MKAEVDGETLLTLLPYRREAKHQRLLLSQKPDSTGLGVGESFTCLVQGKRAIRPLIIEQDTPIITGMEQILIAGAAADVFQTLDKPDQATVFRQKADAALDVLKDRNTVQANQPRRIKSTTVAGNSLGEMIDAVCQICGQWTPEYRQIIREFLRRNYQALYDVSCGRKALW